MCGKTFPVPIKVLDLQAKNPEPYVACPHCLGRILSDLVSEVHEPAIDAPEDADSRQEAVNSFAQRVEEPAAECAHHFGYLSERSSKEKIPEECMVCGKIVDCMLKSVKD